MFCSRETPAGLGGCNAEASILPDTTGTIKELVAFWYNFTYIEVPPSLTYITRNASCLDLKIWFVPLRGAATRNGAKLFLEDSATSTTAIGWLGAIFHLLKDMFVFSPIGFEGTLSLLEIYVFLQT